MDKSKLAAIGLLVILGGGVFLAQSHDAPTGAEDDDHDHDGDGAPDHAGSDHAPDPEAAPKADPKATAALSGGVTKLKVEDISKGTGTEAKNGNHLTMNYKGQLLNGKVFDQSYGKAPFQFQLGAGNVIKGWDLGILGMKEGGKRKLTIPASLGYGDAGAGGDIPGGATLVFEVELIKVDK